MNRKLLALNLALLALIAAAGWRLNIAMNQADSRKSAVVGKPLETVEPPPPNPVEPPPPAMAADYIDVAHYLLFFPDRNPDVVIEVEPPTPLPPMPVAHGVLDLGSGPTIILSESVEAQQRAYQVGDEYNEFRIARISDSAVVFEWEGELITRTIAELKPVGELSPPVRPRQTAQPKAAKPKAAVLGEKKTGPGEVDMGGGIRSCQPGDDTPAGTIVGGYKKIVSQTPFGATCRWEPVR